MEKCMICQKQTDKCCSLCRKLFYCSPEHQQVHWHMTHKFSCEGKHQSLESNQEDFKFYIQSHVKQAYQTQVRTYQEDAKVFMQLFETRLITRSQVVSKYNSTKQAAAPGAIVKELVKESELMVDLSKKVSESYQVGMGQHLQQAYGLVTNNFIVKIDQLLDRVMQARCYQLAFMTRQLKETLIVIANEIEPYPTYLGEQFKKSYRNLLWAVIDISENASMDKIAQKMFANFIKLCERFQGVWEQVYAYFHLGLWYANKTYYHKAIKCFNYASQLATIHKMSQGSVNLKADAIFNIALCSHAIKDKQIALQQMQEAYRLRSQSIGKNSLESSQALMMLAKWCFEDRKYDVCLQYVMQCFRVRKLNPSFAKELQEVNNLIVRIYENIKRERDENQKRGSPSNKKYYDKLLQSQMTYKDQQTDRQESFTKKLLEEEKEYVEFKFDVDESLFEKLTSEQIVKLGELIQLSGRKMQKQQAIRTLYDGQFYYSLSEQQKTQFLKLNKFS